MNYTVKQLAEISGVSARTLHWYDEIGLLKPSFCGQNGYRYYNKDKLLELQQILFFRELGLPLSDIKAIIAQNDFDVVSALLTHKKNLEQIIADKSRLIKTINKTVSSLKGEQEMEDKELYSGFSIQKTVMDSFLDGYSDHLAKFIGEEEAKKNMDLARQMIEQGSMPKDIQSTGQAFLENISKALSEGLSYSSEPVQELIHNNYVWSCQFYPEKTISKKLYLGYMESNFSIADTKKYYDTNYPKGMLEFMEQAMRFYADKNLK